MAAGTAESGAAGSNPAAPGGGSLDTTVFVPAVVAGSPLYEQMVAGARRVAEIPRYW